MVKYIREIWNGKKWVVMPYDNYSFIYYYHPILGLIYQCVNLDEL